MGHTIYSLKGTLGKISSKARWTKIEILALFLEEEPVGFVNLHSPHIQALAICLLL